VGVRAFVSVFASYELRRRFGRDMHGPRDDRAASTLVEAAMVFVGSNDVAGSGLCGSVDGGLGFEACGASAASKSR